MKSRINDVYRFRPIAPEGTKLLRYAEGRWIEDDGETPDLAFVEVYGAIYYYVDMPHWAERVWSWCKHGDWSAEEPRHPLNNPWHYMTTTGKLVQQDWERDKHPNIIAERAARGKCCELHSCANGLGPEFNVLDKYIKAGLVIDQNNTVVQPPEIFECVYCGKIAWRIEGAHLIVRP